MPSPVAGGAAENEQGHQVAAAAGSSSSGVNATDGGDGATTMSQRKKSTSRNSQRPYTALGTPPSSSQVDDDRSLNSGMREADEAAARACAAVARSPDSALLQPKHTTSSVPTGSPDSALLQTRHTNYVATGSLASTAAPSAAAGRAKPKRRLPQSGLTLCGRKWLLGSEDMCLPSCWSSQFDMVLVALAIVAWRYIYTSDYPDSCNDTDKRSIEAYVIMHALGYAALLTTDVCIMISAIRSNMFRRNRMMVYLIYLRLAITAAVVVFTILANIAYFQEFRAHCAPSDGTNTLHRLLPTLFLASLGSFFVFGVYFICAYGFGPCCGKGTVQSWGKHIRRWLLCYTPPTTPANGRNVLESISWIFTEFFAADRAVAEQLGEPMHVVPSDVLVGLALVEANQVRRALLGYRFLKSAPKNRWDADAFHPQQQQQQQQHAPPPSHDSDTFLRTFGSAAPHRSQQQNASAAASSSSSPAPAGPSTIQTPSPDPVGAAERGLYENARALERKEEQALPHERQDTDLADAAGQGIQPALDPRDWQRIADAQHFSKYALGSYGWMLYLFHNASCLLTCRACRCCTRAHYDRHNLVGSGCGTGMCGSKFGGCCHLNMTSFLLTTGVADQDVLYAHLDASPIYYLTIDHAQKCVVICCRGTLSVADVVIDLDAKLSPLDEHGYPGGYTHTGILDNALRLRDDLDERGHLERFMEHHPDYNLTVVGHSLGAATAALLTLLLRDRYDTGLPPVTTAGRITPQTRNRLTCIAYGGPLLVDLGVAQSEFALRCITSIVNNTDIITRLSLASCALLKDQMISCFAVSSTSKWRILANSWRANYTQSFEPGHDMHAVGSPHSQQEDPNDNAAAPEHSTTHGVGTQLMLGSVAHAMRRFDVLPEGKEDEESPPHQRRVEPSESPSDDHTSPTPLHHSAISMPPPPQQAPDMDAPQPTIPAAEVRGPHAAGASSSATPPPSSSTSPPASSEFTLHLRKCYLPGRIYHILPGLRDPAQSRWLGLRRAKRSSVVYPASQDTFQEIIVSKNMFTDHMPEKYQLERVRIPPEFIEPRDGEETDAYQDLASTPPNDAV